MHSLACGTSARFHLSNCRGYSESGCRAWTRTWTNTEPGSHRGEGPLQTKANIHSCRAIRWRWLSKLNWELRAVECPEEEWRGVSGKRSCCWVFWNVLFKCCTTNCIPFILIFIVLVKLERQTTQNGQIPVRRSKSMFISISFIYSSFCNLKQPVFRI